MSYLLSFLFAGVVCSIAQILYDKTKLTPGHIINLFVVIGAVLSFFNIYDFLIDTFSSGATSLITNYGHLLYQSAKKGASTGNYLNIFIELMKSTSGIVSLTIVLALFVGLIRKPKP